MADEEPGNPDVPSQTPAVPEPKALPPVPTRPAAGQPITSAWGGAIHDAVFGLASLPDVRDGWRATAIAANVGSVDMPRSDGGLSPLAGFPGAVVGVWYRFSGGPITAGSINVSAQVGGTIAPPIVLGPGTSTTGTVMLAAPLTVAAAAAIRVNYSSAGLAPAGAIAVQAGLLVRYDYVPG